MLDHTPIPVRDILGVLDRGSDEMVSPKHLIRGQNLIYPGRSIRTRKGFSSVTFGAIAGIRRVHVYKRSGEADRLLILDTTGKLWDSTNAVTPIHDDVDWVDFSCVIMYNRAFISPHNGTKGLAGDFVYVYEGSGIIRKIGGAAPGSSPTVADSPDAGNVSAGYHQFAVAYLTNTGFITKMSTAVIFQSSGGKKVRLTNIPVGGSEITGRWILSSQRIADYNAATYSSDQYEWFFVPNGLISDNITTTFDINFYDTDLVSSADYLIDQLSGVPAGVMLADLDSRLAVGGINTEDSVLRVSKKGDPESFSSIDGFVNVSPGSGFGITNAKGKRGQYYIFKDRRIFVTTDLGTPPNQWPLNEVDVGSGTSCFGIGKVLESTGDTGDRFIYADRSGLQLFTGSIAEYPLTWKIDDIWKRINFDKFNLIQVFINPDDKYLYVSVPLDAATQTNTILFADYSEGLNYDTIKWSTWIFETIQFSSIFMNVNNTTKKVEFRCASSNSNKLYLYDTSVESDDGTFKISNVDYAYIGDLKGRLSVLHFAGIRLRITGSGSMSTIVKSLDGLYTDSLGDDILTTLPGGPLDIKSDVECEKVSYQIELQGITSWMLIDYGIVFAKFIAENR